MKLIPLLLLSACSIQAAGTLAVVSAASFLGGTLAPESIATAFGAGLATGAATAAAPLPTVLLNTKVAVADSAGVTRGAVLFYVSPGQVNFQIPAGTASGLATVTVTSGNGSTSQAQLNIGPVSPALFQAGVLETIVMPDGSQQTVPVNQDCNAIACADYLVQLGGSGTQTFLEIFSTGIRGRSNLSAVVCTMGGVTPAQVQYAGPAPGFTGLDQVNVLVPPFLAGTGSDILLSVDGVLSNAIRLSFTGTTPYDRATSIVSQMTLDEKIQELHGIQDATDFRTVPGVPRLGIPALNITNGPAGVTNGGPGHQGPATALPAPISLAASWDTSLARAYGVVIGKEAYALGNGFLEGPDINIARVPQNGRNFEAFGEDPFLVGQMSANQISGIQSQGVIAEAKHYAGNNQETNRATINDLIDERTLREIYLPAFETSVIQGRAGAVMCAYNQVNSAYSCENNVLMNQILKGDWMFNGFITSDFGAVHSTVPSANSGLDLEMPTGIYFTNALANAVNAGQVPMSTLDDKLIRRFATMMRFGIYDYPPASQPVPTGPDGVIARQIAEAGMVLLKNAGGLLPLNPSSLKSIALIGPYASAAKTGGGGSSQVVPAYTVTPQMGIAQRTNLKVSLSDGSSLTAAASVAQSADVAIVMVGDDEAEGADHPISLSGNQDALVQAVAAANARTIVVLKSGSAILMPWVQNVAAILEAWYPGEEDGNAVAAVLFGDVNPSGKLPMTFPAALADLPANTPAQYPGVNGIANYSEGVFVGYRHFDAGNIAPLFPFGFGLSYTTFQYSNLAIVTTGQGTNVDFDVTNIGSVAGAEIAQVYVAIPPNPVTQPPKQLKGFQKIFLQPQQTGHVHLLLDARAFAYWDVNTHLWAWAQGNYQILVGASSRDIRLTGPLTPAAQLQGN